MRSALVAVDSPSGVDQEPARTELHAGAVPANVEAGRKLAGCRGPRSADGDWPRIRCGPDRHARELRCDPSTVHRIVRAMKGGSDPS